MLLSLLALVTAVPAHAYDTTQFKVFLTRENVRDERPAEIADGGPFAIRYESDGTCFVIGKHTEYVCENDSSGSQFSAWISPEIFVKFALDELTWVQPATRAEFMEVMTKSTGIRLFPLSTDADPLHPKAVAIYTNSIKTPDGKTEFVAL